MQSGKTTFFQRYLKKRNDDYYKNKLTAQKKDPGHADIGPSVIWESVFYNFLITFLYDLRTILITPLRPHWPSIMKVTPKDAFWVFSHIKLSSWVTYPFTWLSQQKWLLKCLPYIPLVGVGVLALRATKDFYDEKNKNLPITLKYLADIASSVLLGVGLGLMQWGSLAAALYTAPYLLMAATAVVATVGLARACMHIYKAYIDRDNFAKHMFNALKEILWTFINAAGIVLTLFGIQSAQQLHQFQIQKFNFKVLTNAANLYTKLAPLTNYVLGAFSGLLLTNIVAKIVTTCSKKCMKPKEQMPDNTLKAAIDCHIESLQDRINAHQTSSKTNFIIKMFNTNMNKRRQAKIDCLTAFKNKINEGKCTKQDLEDLEKNQLRNHPNIYQSFFCLEKGKTEKLIGSLIDSAPIALSNK